MAFKERDQWRVTWRVSGRRFSKMFPLGTPKKVADEFENRLRLRLIDPDLIREDAPTFRDYAAHFQATYHLLKKRAESTRKKDAFSLRDHLLPRFGHLRLSAIAAAEVLSFQLDLSKIGLKPQTVNNIVSCMSAVFRLAVLEAKARANPCRSIPRLTKGKTKPLFWTPAEARAVLAYAKDIDFEAYQVILLGICSGLRPGELAGLKRDCLDFALGYVDVRRTFCSKAREVKETTKGGTDRKVPIPRSVFQALADKRDLTPDELVFPWLRRERAFGWLRLKPLADGAGVKHIRFHGLRHTFASHLVLSGKHPVEIRDLMGHKKLEATDVYMHLADEVNHGVTDCIADGLGLSEMTRGNVRSLRPVN